MRVGDVANVNPLWEVYPPWGWGTKDGAQALSYLRRFGSVTVLNGHIHQTIKKDWTDEQIARQIRDGKKDEMTAFAGKLSTEEIQNVVAYLRTLK